MVRFDHPVDRPTVKSRLLRLPVDRAQNQRATALWPVDRPVDRGNPRVGCLQSVDRPKGLAACTLVCARLVDRSGRSAPGPVDRSVDRQSLADRFKGLENWVFNYQINLIKLLKIH